MKELYPFQQIGAANLAGHYHHLLADEPGLGKTVQAIAAAKMIGAKDVRVICPASVRSQWQREFLDADLPADRWHVFSYNAATQRFAPGNNPGSRFDLLILDEAHFLKSVDSLRTRSVFHRKFGIAHRAKYIWCLTGTPILNRPVELFPLLKTLHPAFAGTKWGEYAQRYCGAYFDGRGINTRGASRIDELRERLNSEGFMTRRTKAQAFPGRIEPLVVLTPVEVPYKDLGQLWKYEEETQNRPALLSAAAEDYSQLGDLSRLLRLTGIAKTQAVITYLLDYLETVNKIVVFFRHREVGARLHAALDGSVIYQGGMSDGEKDAAVARFQTDPGCSVFLGQIDAAGTGINGLQSVCSEVVFAEQDWTPGKMRQAVDRLDRMGAKSDFITARVLHAPGTLESAMLGVRCGKERVIDRVMGPVLV